MPLDSPVIPAVREEATFPKGCKYPTYQVPEPPTIPFMVFGTRVLEYWVLGPSGFQMSLPPAGSSHSFGKPTEPKGGFHTSHGETTGVIPRASKSPSSRQCTLDYS